MNKLARSILALYSYDSEPETLDLESELFQAVRMIARCPTIVAHAYAVKRHYFDNDSLYLHRPRSDMSIAENFLYSIRHDNKFTDEEAKLLDLCLVLHAEHGGGNNSAFACRVLSSSGTDIYSALSAAVGSLKGPKHGGANIQVAKMFEDIQANVKDWDNDDEVANYLGKIIRKEVGDHSGLIYGMGHAIYTLSDPRTVILKNFSRKLAEEKGMSDELRLIETVERLTPEVFLKEKGSTKVMCANVDMYSGFVYKMLGIPQELYTPIFAVARMAGWCAHRIEEVYNSENRIIRPAYKAVCKAKPYMPIKDR
jgi:citrate synthase